MTEQQGCLIQSNQGRSNEFEHLSIEKTTNVCPMCEEYAKRQASKSFVIMSCEGACLRGEIARQAANFICHQLAPDKTARLCLGGAFTKDTGQRSLVKNGKKVIALEGCFLECASRMMKGAVPGLEPEIIIADTLYDFDRSLFGIDELPESEIRSHAERVAQKVAERL